MAQNDAKIKQPKKRRSAWVGVINTILILIVVTSMALMVLSELLIDRPDRDVFGYSLASVEFDTQDAQAGSLIVQKDGAGVLTIPYLARAAAFANSVAGYIVLIFPPCALLVLVQVIAANREQRDETDVQQMRNEPVKNAAQPDDAQKKADMHNAAPQEACRQDMPMQETMRYHAPAQMREMPMQGELPPQPPMVDAAQDSLAREEVLLRDIRQLKHALQESQTRNEQLRLRAVQAIKKAREGAAYSPYVQPPQMPYGNPYAQMHVNTYVSPQPPYGGAYPPVYGTPPYPPQAGYYAAPPYMSDVPYEMGYDMPQPPFDQPMR